MTLSLKRFTSFEFAVGIGYVEAFVNPNQVAYCQPRRRYDTKYDKHSYDGTLIYFQQEAGVLAVKEDIGLVVAMLTSRAGVCRDCHQELVESWMSVCHDCQAHRHNGVDEDYEAARADLLP